MRTTKPTYEQLEKRLAAAEPIVEALKRQEVDAVVGEEKIAFLLLRKVEEAWLERDGEFSALFGLDGIGLIQADTPAFRFSRVNPKFCEIVGYSAEELWTTSYIDLTHPQDRERDLKALVQVVHGKTDAWSIEKRCVCKDGRVIWVAVHAAVVRDHSGRAARIMAMVEDITARKQADSPRQDAQEQLKKQLRGRTAELLQIRRTLRKLVAKGKLTWELQSAIQKFIDRPRSPASDESSVPRTPPRKQEKTRAKKTRRSASRKSPNKPPRRRGN